MSDLSVAAALRSAKRLVVVEAPAGCGKTFQGAEYAREVAEQISPGRVLILTHTNAASDVFAERTRGLGRRIEIRTIDSLICDIASAYHLALGLPPDASSWARKSGAGGFSALANKVAMLLKHAPIVARALSQRYPIIVCDEHQDSSASQHAVALAACEVGSMTRVFGDPMQCIYGDKQEGKSAENYRRWRELSSAADRLDNLNHPHRWTGDSGEMGQWILEARERLRDGGTLDLRKPPRGVTILIAENRSQRYGHYQLDNADRRPIDALINRAAPLMVLAAHNKTVGSLRAFFGRRFPIWEGHMRDHLSAFIDKTRDFPGDPLLVARAMVGLLQKLTTGFSESNFAKAFVHEIHTECAANRRGKPAALQELARILLDQPNHKGVGEALFRLVELIKTDQSFKLIKLDHPRELAEAIRLREFDDADHGLSELARRRTYARPLPPSRIISTVHKAKGLERSHILLMPCNSHHFPDTPAARCLFYVALSRATQSLTLVASRSERSPLVTL